MNNLKIGVAIDPHYMSEFNECVNAFKYLVLVYCKIIALSVCTVFSEVAWFRVTI